MQSAERVSSIPTDRRSVEVILLNNCTIRFIVEVRRSCCHVGIVPYHLYMRSCPQLVMNCLIKLLLTRAWKRRTSLDLL